MAGHRPQHVGWKEACIDDVPSRLVVAHQDVAVPQVAAALGATPQLCGALPHHLGEVTRARAEARAVVVVEPHLHAHSISAGGGSACAFPPMLVARYNTAGMCARLWGCM